MSIQAFPVQPEVANKIRRVLSKHSPTSDFTILPVSGSPLVYVRERSESGMVTMHGKELGKQSHRHNLYQVRSRERAQRLSELRAQTRSR